MEQTRETSTQNLAERWCWEVARRDDSRLARRLYRKPLVDGVSRLNEGALLDDFFHFLQTLGVIDVLAQGHGTAIQRAMLPCVQSILLDGLKTLVGIARMTALPHVWLSDEALMRLVGFNAQQVRQGICQRGVTKRPGARPPGPLGADTLAKNIVKLNLRELEAVVNGAIRALANAGVFGAKVTGIADGTALQTTEPYTGGGRVTRNVRIEDQRGRVHEMEVTVYGWKILLWIDAVTKMPLAVKVGPSDEHETHWTRALVTQARAKLGDSARRHKVVFDKGFLDGTELWWLDQHARIFVVPATAHMAVTTDARAQAAAQEGLTLGRRVHTVRHGQGRGARTERRETEVVGITGLPPDDQDGTPEHGRYHTRRDVQAHAINAVVVRQWPGRD
jgi:hypothetical protein